MKRASLVTVVLGGVLFGMAGPAIAQSLPTREQVRAEMAQAHFGVAEVLSLDAARFEKLIDLLTDQRMEQRAESSGETATSVNPSDWRETLIVRAERLNQGFEAVRAVLGPEKFDRYHQTLRYTLGNRQQARELDDRLDSNHKLGSSQREQLVALLHEYTMREIDDFERRVTERAPLTTPTSERLSQEEIQRRKDLRAVANNQEAWRRQKQADRQMLDRAARFLTPSQLASLQAQRTQRTKDFQTQVERLRTHFGLSPVISDESPASDAILARIAGEVTLRMVAIVNRGQPQYFTEVVSSGKPVTFQIDDGLLLEATLVLFEQDLYELRLSYYEVGSAGKRWLGSQSPSGTVVRAPPDDPSRLLGAASGTITMGNKAYALHLGSAVEAT